MENSIVTLIVHAGLVVKVVLAVLFLFSVVSWAIIFFKHRYLSQARKETVSFMKAYSISRKPDGLYTASRKYSLSPVCNVFKAVYIEPTHPDRQELRRAIKRYEALESEKLERHLTFLATTGSSTPFIGLFGTVWGIMDSFRGIGAAGSASLTVVAPGIAEALIATAFGLMAAIPATIAYNYYLSRVRTMTVEMEDFSEELIEMFLSRPV